MPIPQEGDNSSLEQTKELLSISSYQNGGHPNGSPRSSRYDRDSDDSEEDEETGHWPRSSSWCSCRRRKSWILVSLVGVVIVVIGVVAIHGYNRSTSKTGETPQVPLSDYRLPGWGKPTEAFFSVGRGRCMNVNRRPILKFAGANASYTSLKEAFQPAKVALDGSSVECQERCAVEPRCTGFATRLPIPFAIPAEGGLGMCGLTFESQDDYPAGADGTEGFFCFWRHRFLKNSQGAMGGLQSIPMKVWSYWQVIENSKSESVLMDFIGLCQDSFRKLNPGWEVHMLDQHSVWKYLDASDLPKAFNSLSIQHRSDAIRLALLVKYGGVWLDASTLLLKPFRDIIGSDPYVRTFYINAGLKGQPIINARYSEGRYSSAFHVENWYFASPAGDPFLNRTRDCVMEFHKDGDSQKLHESGLFTKRQLEDLGALGIWNYLATDACMFKVLDEDLAMYQWWISPRVRRINFLGHLDPAWFADPKVAFVKLFMKVDPEMMKVLTQELYLLKLTGQMRDALLKPLSAKPTQIVGCGVDSTWVRTLKAKGLFNSSKCT
eukprot:TRINITY_DN11490_c0_g4_i1.p1 TRINITY_DN11490_c0_g4~~TRINITY_DN11490_c0_g4_i1.p1  ORF type:complete len:549 (-),score=59.46 TRINITY_DN11490_c0_g4_i1:211-1857(-)